MENRLQFGLLMHHLMDSTTAYYQLLNVNNILILENKNYFYFEKIWTIASFLRYIMNLNFHL